MMWLPDTTWIPGVLSFVAGYIVKAVGARLGRFEYWVNHGPVGLGGNDPVWGEVKLTWQGSPTSNLWASTVTLVNATDTDYSDVRFKVYTGNDTTLLTEQSSIVGTPYAVKYAPDFAAQFPPLEEGEPPSPARRDLLHHAREYLLPVFNRGQQVRITYLTTTTNPPGKGPFIWLDVQHKGVVAKFLMQQSQILQVPTRKVWPVAAAFCVVVLFAIRWLELPAVAAAPVAMLAGGTSALVGALLVRGFRWLRKAIAIGG